MKTKWTRPLVKELAERASVDEQTILLAALDIDVRGKAGDRARAAVSELRSDSTPPARVG